MKYIQAKQSRLHCSTCDETYSLPQNGNIKLYKELKCPLDEFEYFLCSENNGADQLRSYCAADLHLCFRI